jgi:bleomycin hydrolase
MFHRQTALMQPGTLLIKRFGWSVLALGLIAPVQAQSLREKLTESLEKTPHPHSAADFQPVPGLPCLNQGKTLVCWSFATTSFLESEMARLKLEPVRLSVMYPVYCAYVEKAQRFAQTKGGSRFSPGDLFTGLTEVCREYGALPANAYDKPADGGVFDQTRLYADLENFIQDVKLQGKWDEARLLSRVKKILNRHLGEPPKTFSYQGKAYTPKSFLAEVVRLPWTDYLMITSFESAPFNTFTELKVPDNWRHNTNFFNVPLPVFYDALKGALRAGFSAAIDLDTTEPSYENTGRYCLIPDFDLPADRITQAARELRFLNGATSDDHAIHMIGFNTFGGEDWFLAKDSWKVAWRDGNQGSLFLHSSYVKLKILAFQVHRDGVPQVTALLPARRGS